MSRLWCLGLKLKWRKELISGVSKKWIKKKEHLFLPRSETHQSSLQGVQPHKVRFQEMFQNWTLVAFSTGRKDHYQFPNQRICTSTRLTWFQIGQISFPRGEAQQLRPSLEGRLKIQKIHLGPITYNLPRKINNKIRILQASKTPLSILKLSFTSRWKESFKRMNFSGKRTITIS